jgi:hypothetical protein
VAVSGSTIAVGSPYDDLAATNRGVAYVYAGNLSHVVGRYVFYNNSYWDGNDAGPGATDDAAIAPGKYPLLPGQTATFANYTSYSRGINGIMIDVANLPAGTPTAADFEFRVGNSNTPGSWPLAGVAPAISVRRGAGVNGSDRITLIFPDGAVTKQWLGVKVLAAGAVDLAADDVFYFGNAIGEAGDSAVDAKVTTLDVSLTRANQISFPTPPPVITNPYDFNRDHKVNTMDVSLVRSNLTTVINALKLITVPAAAMLTDDDLAKPQEAATALGTDDGFAKPQAAMGTPMMDLLAVHLKSRGSLSVGLG